MTDGQTGPEGADGVARDEATRAEGRATPRPATCPFCLEAINLHARRCKHCGAELGQSEAPSQDGQKVVYVLDRDLVRFAKVSLSLLGLFAVAGVYFLGIDLKSTVRDMDELRREVEADGATVAEQVERVGAAERAILAQQQDLRTKHAEINATVAAVGALRTEVQSAAGSAKQALDLILKTQDKVLVVAETLSISPDGTATVRSTVTTVGVTGKGRRSHKLWETGSTLHVRFLGGARDEHEAVKDAAQEWSQHANIRFVFDDSESAQIKVAFAQGEGSWSYVGTDALAVAPGSEPTMNFGWSIVNDRDTLLHNLGHALGLLHEHQNPLNGIEWDERAIYEQMAGPPNRWSREQIYENFVRKYTADDYAVAKPFDANSIMMYPFDAGLLKAPFENGILPDPGLSKTDVEYIAQLYPRVP